MALITSQEVADRLTADVAKAFPTEDSVNKALRSLMEVAQRSVR
jgi:hypothetical protein